jgi:serine/threonine protein phosphatase PrpC
MTTTEALRVTVMTHRGAVRENNEDAVVVGPFTICGVSQQDPVVCELPLSAPTLIAVADGMGGHAAGALASSHTVRSLATAAPQDEADIEAGLQRIDLELLTMSKENPTIANLGTTVAGLLLTLEGGLRFGVGDSRVYVQYGGYLAQISVDDRGPTGGLTQCLGGRPKGSPLRATVEPLSNYDRILLCSDGLSDLVQTKTIEEILNKPQESTRKAKSLWATAMNASGRDNITVILIEKCERK